MAPIPSIARRLAHPAAAFVIAASPLSCLLPRSAADGDAPSSAVVEGPSLHNGSGADRVLRVRPLSSAVDLDCDAIAERPAARLPAALFSAPVPAIVPRGGDLPLFPQGDAQRGCTAALVEGDALPPTIAFWRADDREAEIRLVQRDDALQLDDGGAAIVHASVEPEPTPAACAVPDDGARLAWSAPVPTGARVLERIEVGLDGCLALAFAGDEHSPWYLCAPADAFPFASGDAIEVEPLWDTGVEGVRLRDATRELVVARGSAAPAVLDLQWTLVPVDGCTFASSATCGTVGRAAALEVSSAAFGAGTVRAGGAVLQLRAADGRRMRIEPAVVQQRVALDPACALGPDVLGTDIEVVVTIGQGST